MKYVISRFNHDMEPIMKYARDYVVYDRSDIRDWITCPYQTIRVENIGTDIYDKLTWIIDNYDNLPDVFCLTKANLFKYITEDEFIDVMNNKSFTPLLTQHHKVDDHINRYRSGMYEEINNYWYLNQHPCRNSESFEELKDLLGLRGREYLRFAPGSNYILTKENVLKHPKEFYEKLRSYLKWDVYPGEAQIIERNLYYIWS